MSRADELAALEALTLWDEQGLRAGLALLRTSTADAARQYAADAAVLAELAAQVPRFRGDETGGTPWTSFRREVAIARSCSDQAAATDIRHALRLSTVLPQTRDLLEAGRLPVARARAFLDELDSLDDEIAGQLDADLADRVGALAPWRIKQEVRKAALGLDSEVASRRTADATDKRDVSLLPQPDGQAGILISGPAVPVTRWFSALDQQARALKQEGDPRTLAQLRFDLAVTTLPCFSHAPADASAYVGLPSLPGARADASPFAGGTAAAGLRPTGVEAAAVDCRRGRPVQAMIVLPVETSLGLSNEPAWLDGYGWIDAPTARLLLVDAELRRVCSQSGSGQLVDVAERDVRPPPTPDGVRTALLAMISDPITLSDSGFRVEPQHDPTDPLRAFVALRDRSCDGPTGSRIRAIRADLDHGDPWPGGPTAAWNLFARGRRTHQLKHYGWTPLRTPAATIWISPAGQTVEVPHHTGPPPGIDLDPAGWAPTLPDAGELAKADLAETAAPRDDDLPPWLPTEQEMPVTTWTWLDGSEPPPF